MMITPGVNSMACCFWMVCALLHLFISECTSDAPCVKNVAQVQREGRRCAPFCSASKPCRDPRSTTCLCDGNCGFVCVSNDLTCDHLFPPDHGSVHFPEGFGFQAIAIYDCDDDYELIGPDERVCRGDGRWTREEPICVHEDVHCNKPRFNVEHAYADIWPERDTFYVHDEVQYKCENGFTSSRGDYATTQCVQRNPSSIPIWTPIRLTCKPIECSYPDDIDNGYFEGKSFSFNAQVFYRCNAGFTLVGSSTRTCLSDQEWSGSLPLCKVLTCPNPTDLPHGFVKYKSVEYLSTAWYHCDPGYTLVGINQHQCLADASWSGEQPRCIEVSCAEQRIPDNGRVLHQNGTGLNNYVDYVCDDHTTTIGSTRVTCIMEGQEGKWSSPPPTCLRQCQVMNIPNGFSLYRSSNLNPGDYVDHGASVQVSCGEGFELSLDQGSAHASDSIRCDDGTWSSRVKCAEAKCSHQTLSRVWLRERNLELSNNPLNSWSEHGEQVSLHCSTLYPEMQMDGSITCQAGKWVYPHQHEVRCIPRSCSISDIIWPHGSIYIDDNEIDPQKQDKVLHSTVLLFECNKNGFELYEEGKPVNLPYGSLQTCSNGTLLGFHVECKPGRCACKLLRTSLSNNQLESTIDCELTQFAESGTQVELTCANGFQAQAQLYAQCTQSQWTLPINPCKNSAEQPETTSMAPAEVITQSAVTTTTTPEPDQNDQEIMFEGFLVVEPPVRPADCRLVVKNNSVLSYYEEKLVTRNSIFRAGSSLTFRCQDISRYSFFGKIKRLCRKGNWLGEEAKCVKLNERDVTSAPVIEFTTTEGSAFVAGNGSLMVTEYAILRLRCLWEKNKENAPMWKWRNQKIQGNDVLIEWAQDGQSFDLEISRLGNSRSGMYTCTSKNKKTHGIHVRSTRELPTTTTSTTTTTTTTTPAPTTTPSTTTTTTPTVTVPTSTSPLPTVILIKENDTRCRLGNTTSLNVYENGFRVASERLFPHGSKLTTRCTNIFDFKMEGNRNIRCVKGRWMPQWPQCTRLLSNNWDSPPPLSISVSVNKSSVGVTENGEVFVPKFNLIYLMCNFALDDPILSVKGINTNIVRDFYNSDGDVIWYLQLGPFQQMVSFTFVCRIPRDDVTYAHSIVVRVGDTCTLNDRKWRSLLIPGTKRNVYLEGDIVQLQCRNKLALIPSYLTCSKGGVWINGPILKCNQANN